jgi:hypothetical protein
MIWEGTALKLKLEAQIKLKVYIQTKKRVIKSLEKLKKNYLTLLLLVIMNNSKKNKLEEVDLHLTQMNI